MAEPLLLRWPDRQAAHEPLLAELGADRILDAGPVEGAVTSGLWPGIQSEGTRGNDPAVASASREPWVNGNGHILALRRALSLPPLLALEHKDPARGVPFDSLELALVEARVNGGNAVLTVEPRYREALLSGDASAREAWKALARTAAWLKENAALFGRPTLPAITAVVEPGFATQEVANLLYRRGASPALSTAVNLPAPGVGGIEVLVAAGLKQIPGNVFAHAAAGATAVIDLAPPKAAIEREDTDRTIYRHGKGRIVAYHKRIQDPSEFALDCIDLLTHRRRAARLWNAPAAIPLATAGGLLHIVQYGGPIEGELQARVRGNYSRATLLRPEAPPKSLPVFRRGEMTEVFPHGIRRVAVVKFE